MRRSSEAPRAYASTRRARPTDVRLTAAIPLPQAVADPEQNNGSRFFMSHVESTRCKRKQRARRTPTLIDYYYRHFSGRV